MNHIYERSSHVECPFRQTESLWDILIQDICDKTAILLINFQFSNTLFYLNEIQDGSVMTLKRYWILDNLNSDFKGRLLNKTDYLKCDCSVLRPSCENRSLSFVSSGFWRNGCNNNTPLFVYWAFWWLRELASTGTLLEKLHYAIWRTPSFVILVWN